MHIHLHPELTTHVVEQRWADLHHLAAHAGRILLTRPPNPRGTPMTTTTSTTTPVVAVLCQRFAVIGMTCSHCERAVAVEVMALPGVADARADATAGTLVIESARELGRTEVAGAVDEAGYELAR